MNIYPEWRDGYKIVSPKRDGLYSDIQSDGRGGIKYELGKITMPKQDCGPLCVFAEMEDLVRYLDGNPVIYGRRIHHCKFIKSQLEAVWYNPNRKMPLRDLPAGTVLADAVILTEEVSDDEIKKTVEEI